MESPFSKKHEPSSLSSRFTAPAAAISTMARQDGDAWRPLASEASTSAQQLPQWPPPALHPRQLDHLTASATDFAFAHGLVYRPPTKDAREAVDTSSVIHAPFSLLPSPFPRELFAYAQRLQPIYNELYARITLDHSFLEDVFVNRNVIKVDDFQEKLWRTYETVRQEGIAQVRHHALSPHARSDH